jgi:hypothetical protein
MDPDRLAHIEDVTRRYGRYRPCGAGLGVVWGGVLLGVLGSLLLLWTRTEYAARTVESQTPWRFLRDTPLPPPGWLQVAAMAAPFVGWLGLLAIQAWVDRQFGAVTAEPSADCGRKLRGPRWFAPFVVGLLACLLSGALLWSDGAAAVRAVVAMLTIAAWALVWGRGSRDQLTLMVMFVVSVPSLYLMAATDPLGNFAAGNLIIFGSYFALMLWLLVQGVIRFSGFMKVRADLAAIEPVDE